MTHLNRTEYETARRVEMREVVPGSENKKPFLAAAIVQGRKDARLVPIQVVDFYRGNP